MTTATIHPAIASVNPATGRVVRSFTPLSEAELEARIQRSVDTYRRYRRTPVAERARLLLKSAEILEAEKEKFGQLMVLEMGKTMKAAVEEAAKCAWGCRYYAENAERFLADDVVQTNATRSYVTYQPIGPILAVMPWNFPFWQVFRFAVPALAAGNVALLKHASNVPQCALAIEEIFHRAGFPEGCFQTLLIETEHVRQVIEDPRVMAVTLTGSTGAGSAVAGTAGKQIKKSVLELGGSDPFIVMPSADLEAASRTAVKARTINNGQSCIAAKRFIVVGAIADEFERRLVAGMRALVVGDPMDPATDVGPLANEAQVKTLTDQVERSVRAGARLLTGGHPLDRPGYYFAPGVLTNISTDSPAYREEVFGPIALLFRARDIDEAIQIANDSPFGLGSSAWTTDERERDRFIGDLETGMVFINGMVASDPRLPFGGVKQSGYGRELGVYGMREFVNIKTVWINDAGGETPNRLANSE
ncbi:MAG TPA: NAD-dependent succinate-semialdehyde dehydrogenase [Gemmatimonadales bacterium]|jgi:succinate-semialdehyde dehydrogenase/glutarate-semialdehyde dehydrogenase